MALINMRSWCLKNAGSRRQQMLRSKIYFPFSCFIAASSLQSFRCQVIPVCPLLLSFFMGRVQSWYQIRFGSIKYCEILFRLDYSKSSNFQIFSGISLKIDLVIFAFVKKYPSGLLYIYVSDLPELKFLAIMKKSEIFSSVQFRVHCRSVQSSQKNKFRIQEKW